VVEEKRLLETDNSNERIKIETMIALRQLPPAKAGGLSEYQANSL